jgi:cell division septation protein DedD
LRTKPQPLAPKPSLIHWPIVAAASAGAVVFLAGTLAAAWFVSRTAGPPKERPVPLAEVPHQAETPSGPATVDEPAAALPAPETVAKETAALATPVEPKPSESEPLSPTAPPACETFGTRLQFVSNPTDAARLARQDNKLLFILHISGNFEDDKFT